MAIWNSLKFSLKFGYCSVNGSTTGRSLFFDMEWQHSIPIPNLSHSIISCISLQHSTWSWREEHTHKTYESHSSSVYKGLLTSATLRSFHSNFCKPRIPQDQLDWRRLLRLLSPVYDKTASCQQDLGTKCHVQSFLQYLQGW